MQQIDALEQLRHQLLDKFIDNFDALQDLFTAPGSGKVDADYKKYVSAPRSQEEGAMEEAHVRDF